MNSFSKHSRQLHRQRGRRRNRSGNSSQTALLGIVWAVSLVLAGLLGFFVGKSYAPDTDAGSQAKSQTEKTPAQAGSEVPPGADKEPPEGYSATVQLQDDLRRAITLLDEGRFTIFLQDYLSRRDLERMGDRIAEAADRADADEVAMLREHITACLNGDIVLSQDEQLAEVTYVLSAPQHIPERRWEPVTQEEADFSTVDVRELSNELPTFLTQAAELLREEQFAEFIAGAYPLEELSELGTDGLQRLVFRIRANPAMVEAMLRDLDAAAAADVQLNADGTQATVILPPLASGDSERTLKFDRVANSWRFHDSDREIRDEYGRLMSQPLDAYTIPGVRGMMRFERDGDHWRMREPPQTEPIVE